MKPSLAFLVAAWPLVACSGCSYFGIDTRPDIEYRTLSDNRPRKEPMYERKIPGTNLVKRWPTRRGLEYGFAPWEKKTDAVEIPAPGSESPSAGVNPDARAMVSHPTANGASATASTTKTSTVTAPSAQATASAAGSQPVQPVSHAAARGAGKSGPLKWQGKPLTAAPAPNAPLVNPFAAGESASIAASNAQPQSPAGSGVVQPRSLIRNAPTSTSDAAATPMATPGGGPPRPFTAPPPTESDLPDVDAMVSEPETPDNSPGAATAGDEENGPL